MSALVQRGNAQGRPMALVVTIALHVALVAGLLAIKVVEAVRDIHHSHPGDEHRGEKPRPVPVETPIVPYWAVWRRCRSRRWICRIFARQKPLPRSVVDIPQDVIAARRPVTSQQGGPPCSRYPAALPGGASLR